MRIIAMLVLIFGVALAGGAIYFASNYFEEYEARMRNNNSGPELVNVVVAKVQLPYGTIINPQKHLRWAAWPKNSLPQGAFTDAAALIGTDDMDPEERQRVVLRQIEPGEPILETKVSGFGQRKRMAMQLREGKRAFSIRINPISGVSGFIAPGDRVDILMTRGSPQGLQSKVIMQNVLVIAVDHETNTEANRPKNASTATVEVTPAEANKLVLAQQVGQLSLTLRGMTETDVAEETEAISVRDVWGIEEAAPQPVVRERNSTSVTVRKGGAVTNRLEFETGE